MSAFDPFADTQNDASLVVMAGFPDRVRIKASEDTQQLGLAGREGQVYGFTTPSVTGVSVIGSPCDDYAVNVHFDDLDASFWFSEDLVEMLDHGAGTVISLDGHDMEWVRLASGEWEQRARSE